MSFLRYFPADPRPTPWGVKITGGGDKSTGPYEPYPSGREHHPEQYWFEWHDGRVLAEMAFILIRNGEGEFESSSAGKVALRHGTLVFLHPGVWHRYRPAPAVGYDEIWATFTGDYVRGLIFEYFPPERPVVQLFDIDELYRLVLDLHRLIGKGFFQNNRTIAIVRLLEIVARARQDSDLVDPGFRLIEKRLEKTCGHLLTCPPEVEWRALALRAGMSLSHFRRKFRELTGYSPHDYWLHVRIKHIKEELRASDATLEALAERYNFHDAAHLSKTFSRISGMSPGKYRKSRD